jgi:dUTP pyrophosphatase
MSRIKINVSRLPHGEGLPLPAYETAGAAGMDLIAAVEEGSGLELSPGTRKLVPTGLIFQLPEGYEGQVRPRSGLAFRNGITVANAPGTIDSDYRGEVQVLLVNLGQDNCTVTRGMRVAQFVVAPVVTAELVETDVINETIRGAGGFGSTGTGGKKG